MTSKPFCGWPPNEEQGRIHTVSTLKGQLHELESQGHGDKEVSIRGEYALVTHEVPTIGADYVDFYGIA